MYHYNTHCIGMIRQNDTYHTCATCMPDLPALSVLQFVSLCMYAKCVHRFFRPVIRHGPCLSVRSGVRPFRTCLPFLLPGSTMLPAPASLSLSALLSLSPAPADLPERVSALVPVGLTNAVREIEQALGWTLLPDEFEMIVAAWQEERVELYA